MAARPPRLGKEQYRILEILWQHGSATARQITEEFNRTTPTAHSTIQTLLRQLENKGVVAHQVEDRTFVYRPLLQPSEVTETPLRDLLVRVYQGSVYNLMSHLLKNEKVSAEELTQLRNLLDEEKPE